MSESQIGFLIVLSPIMIVFILSIPFAIYEEYKNKRTTNKN